MINLLMTILITIFLYATYKQIEGGAKPSKVLYQTLIVILIASLITYNPPRPTRPVEGFEPDPLNLSIDNFVVPDDQFRTYEKPCEACKCRHSKGWSGRGFQWCCDDSCDNEGELVPDNECSGNTTVFGDYPYLGSIRGGEHGDKCTAEEKVTGFTKSYTQCQKTDDSPCNLWGKNTAWNGYDHVHKQYESKNYEINNLQSELNDNRSTIDKMNSQISDLQFKLEQCQSSSPTPSPDIP